MMSSTGEDFAAFMQRRRLAAEAYTNGESAPLRELTTENSPATFFAPMGGTIDGAAAVWADYERGAQSFAPGSETQLEILHQGASGDLGYWTGLQHARVRFRGKPDPVPMVIRVTEIFRREGGKWKMIHRHADPLAQPQPRN